MATDASTATVRSRAGAQVGEVEHALADGEAEGLARRRPRVSTSQLAVADAAAQRHVEDGGADEQQRQHDAGEDERAGAAEEGADDEAGTEDADGDGEAGLGRHVDQDGDAAPHEGGAEEHGGDG